MIGRVAEPVRTLTVAPTFDPVPMMRRSPDFHLALVIVIWSVILVGVNEADLADSSPYPAPFWALTARVEAVSAASLVTVSVLAVVSCSAPAGLPVRLS